MWVKRLAHLLCSGGQGGHPHTFASVGGLIARQDACFLSLSKAPFPNVCSKRVLYKPKSARGALLSRLHRPSVHGGRISQQWAAAASSSERGLAKELPLAERSRATGHVRRRDLGGLFTLPCGFSLTHLVGKSWDQVLQLPLGAASHDSASELSALPCQSHRSLTVRPGPPWPPRKRRAPQHAGQEVGRSPGGPVPSQTSSQRGSIHPLVGRLSPAFQDETLLALPVPLDSCLRPAQRPTCTATADFLPPCAARLLLAGSTHSMRLALMGGDAPPSSGKASWGAAV